MNDMLKNELDDIRVSYELLIDGIEILEIKIREEYIPKCSIDNEMHKVIEAANLNEQLKLYLKDILALRDKWKSLVNEDNIYDEEQDEQNDKDAVDRTSWSIENNNIRIETIRKDGNSVYPNIIPIEIFVCIIDTILDQFEKYNKTIFKKASIASLMKEKIINETNYKKSPDTVVYSVIKVLLKENILKRNQNYKSIYTLNINPDEIRKWYNNNLKK
ncbi:hypothetical protein [Methanobrevibacter sp. UBA46]|jgi:hypothetical protein|uniref:hypothetical protein n=1 Tax=Methanobrevibacter sp. UBA46 TaxID=1915488 RepID=UPI0039B994B1